MDIDIPFTIKGLRQAGMTQTQIGRELKLSQTSVSDMEAGKAGVTRPSYTVVSTLKKLASRYRLPIKPPSPAQQSEPQ